MLPSFDVFILLISTPSEILILSYANIYDLYKHSSKKIVDKVYHLLQK